MQSAATVKSSWLIGFLYLLGASSLLAQPAPDQGWFAFDPGPDPFLAASATDLRFLNEKSAGENGWIQVKDGRFVHARTDQPVRFWAVNGPPNDLKGEPLRRCARLLAKYGVNMVRFHGGLFDREGEVDASKVLHAIEIVEAMKAEGIYTHFSIYFPLWLTPKPGTPWLEGYDGKQHPFAALFFNQDFQAQYRKWWTALLTTPSPATGRTLVEEPAVAALEMQNEDSFFFWTFSEKNIPDRQLRVLEKLFGAWVLEKHGSFEAALAAWNGLKVNRDAFAEGRAGFRPLWNIFNEKTPRDQDTVRFLFQLQTRFYTQTYAFLRHLGFRGAITASNWSTASPEVFGPLEKLSYTSGDFIDRHGYFSCNHKGQFAEWSLRDGHTYSDRSALRFDAEVPGKPKQFVHPAMDPHYDNKPSMISETTWTRPNRFRSEAPLYLASFGALQATDAVVHFALDGADWKVKPRFWMQPWTLMTPAMLGQFPAAALIYRRGLVSEGRQLATVHLNRTDLLALQGTPLPQEAALDELRLKDVPATRSVAPGKRLDPLLHYSGRTAVSFTTDPSRVVLAETRSWINHADRVVTSSTAELKLDYGRGLLFIDAAAAQGVSGSLAKAKMAETRDLTITSELQLGHIVAVALDGQPLNQARRILLQVMSEEKTSGFRTEDVSPEVRRIVSIGQDPWQVKELQGVVRFKRADADELQVTRLNHRGEPLEVLGHAREIHLRPDTLYYLISR